MRTRGRWFNPQLGHNSFQGLMMIAATGFISLTRLSVVSTTVMRESSQWLGKGFVLSTGKNLRNSMDRRAGRRNITEVMLNNAQSESINKYMELNGISLEEVNNGTAER